MRTSDICQDQCAAELQQQRIGGLFPVSEISRHFAEAEQAAAFIPNRSNHDVGPESRTIFTYAPAPRPPCVPVRWLCVTLHPELRARHIF